MSEHYEELLDGHTHLRVAPGARHEMICDRLHTAVAACVTDMKSTRLLSPRTSLQLSNNTILCPDLALLTAANSRLLLAAEIVDSGDHRPDTVLKKQIYEDMRVPRLWMIDPRYDNVEVYHSTEFGLSLQGILAGQEVLTEKLIPEFQIVVAELFNTNMPTS